MVVFTIITGGSSEETNMANVTGTFTTETTSDEVDISYGGAAQVGTVGANASIDVQIDLGVGWQTVHSFTTLAKEPVVIAPALAGSARLKSNGVGLNVAYSLIGN